MTDIFERLERRLVAITQRIAFAGVVVMLILAFLTTIDVLLRWLINDPMNGLNEVVAMGIAVAVASTFPAGAAQRVNLTIDLLHGKVPIKAMNWLKVAAAFLLLVFYILLAWQIGVYASKLQARHATTIYLLMPTFPFVWIVSAFVAFAALVQILMIFSTVRYALAGVDMPPAWSIGGSDETAPVHTVPQVAPARVWMTGLGVLFLGAALVAGFYNGLDTISEFARNEPFAFSLILVGVLWLALILSVPLAAVMGLLGLFATICFLTLDPALSVLGNAPVEFLTNYEVAVLPMFLLMGSFAVVAGMSSDIYELAHKLLAHRRGGLALATVGGCAGFGALTGSSLATVATIGRVALPEMASRGYSTGLAAGSVAAGGTLGALVPPSIPLVFYALLTEKSIGDLFVAAVIPAAMAVVFYLTAIAIQVRLDPGAAPVASARSRFSEIWAALKKAWTALALLTVVVGAIYSGICTETEAAAVGAGGAFIVALARGRMNRQSILQVMGETTATTALLYLIISGVLMFTFSMGVTGLPEKITSLIADIDVKPVFIIIMILAVYIALGAIMDSHTVMFVTIPIITPVIVGMNYDLVWWGIVNLVVLELGLITPPFGIHLFVLKSIGGAHLTLGQIYRGVMPFVAADMFKLLLLILFPALALWLPSTMPK